MLRLVAARVDRFVAIIASRRLRCALGTGVRPEASAS
jgi:hypothetical protein